MSNDYYSLMGGMFNEGKISKDIRREAIATNINKKLAPISRVFFDISKLGNYIPQSLKPQIKEIVAQIEQTIPYFQEMAHRYPDLYVMNIAIIPSPKQIKITEIPDKIKSRCNSIKAKIGL